LKIFRKEQISEEKKKYFPFAQTKISQRNVFKKTIPILPFFRLCKLTIFLGFVA